MVWKEKNRVREENLSLYVSFRKKGGGKEGEKKERGVWGGEKKNTKLLRKATGEKLEFSLDSFLS